MSHPIDQHVGRRIRERRKLIDQSQETLAGALGVTFQQIQKYERATNRVSASKLWLTAQAQGVHVSWYFDGLDPDSKPARDQAVAGELMQ